MNRITAYLSVTILTTATAYGMDRDNCMDTDYGYINTEKPIAIQNMGRMQLIPYEVTLPEQAVIEQRIRGLNLPDSIFEIKFDKAKLIADIAELKKVSTIGDVYMQAGHAFGAHLNAKRKIDTLWALLWTHEREAEYYNNNLRPLYYKILEVILQDHPEHATLMAQITKQKLI